MLKKQSESVSNTVGKQFKVKNIVNTIKFSLQ